MGGGGGPNGLATVVRGHRSPLGGRAGVLWTHSRDDPSQMQLSLTLTLTFSVSHGI